MLDDYQAGLFARGLHEALAAAGLRVVSVGVSPEGVATIEYFPGSSVVNEARAEAIVAAYGTRPRRPRPLEAICADLARLSDQQLESILRDFPLRALAVYCQQQPHYLRRPPFDPSIDVAGDEPLPEPDMS